MIHTDGTPTVANARFIDNPDLTPTWPAGVGASGAAELAERIGPGNVPVSELPYPVGSNVKVGDELRNGALVIAVGDETPEGARYVLCWAQEREYVSWLLDHNGYAHYGHYSRELLDAVLDFTRR